MKKLEAQIAISGEAFSVLDAARNKPRGKPFEEGEAWGNGVRSGGRDIYPHEIGDLMKRQQAAPGGGIVDGDLIRLSFQHGCLEKHFLVEGIFFRNLKNAVLRKDGKRVCLHGANVEIEKGTLISGQPFEAHLRRDSVGHVLVDA